VNKGRVVDVVDCDMFKECLESGFRDGGPMLLSEGDVAGPSARIRVISSRKFFLKKPSRVSWNGINSGGQSLT
jgi:hypothetical protein